MESTRGILIHYGILGMKWGVRRTPEQLGHKVGSQALKYDSQAKRTTKRIVKRAVAQTLAYLIPGFGALYNAKVAYDAYQNLANVNPEAKQHKVSELTKKSSTDKTPIDTDVKEVNNTGKAGYVRNCFNCVCALEMRQRGYDVVASPRNAGTSEKEYLMHFSNVKVGTTWTDRKPNQSRKEWVEESYKNLCSDLSKSGPNARGFVGFSYEGSATGHTVMWFTDDKGQVSFVDPQTGSTNATNTLSLSGQQYTWGRLDNCKVKDSITQVVENKEDKR